MSQVPGCEVLHIVDWPGRVVCGGAVKDMLETRGKLVEFRC